MKCRIYDTNCINPRYCDERDACCAGDPDCRPEVTIDAEYFLKLKRAVFELVELAQQQVLASPDEESKETWYTIRNAKELIRCTVQECGLGGACDGKGLDQYPCPLRNVRIATTR
jgi:HEPN domain-containing protein